jgi:Oxidoreductase family, NAD-binding Rossmann fold/Oxidoreductase family, C-terminal alpha/beta domain
VKLSAREVASRLQIRRSLGDWREIVADPGIDALSIAVPPDLQAPIVLAAASAGKHVFREKPVATTVGQAREMLAAVEAARVVHAVDFIFPEIAAWKEARTILQSGTLGALRHVALSWRVETYTYRANRDSWKLRLEEGGGTLNTFASHSLSYLEWLFGLIHHVARVPTHDPSNGFRLFSRRVLETIPIELKVGFAYSIELLVKCHRLGWKIGEVPVSWYERKSGQSRFRVLRWLPQYLRWFLYAFATMFLLRKPVSVMLKKSGRREVSLTP